MENKRLIILLIIMIAMIFVVISNQAKASPQQDLDLMATTLYHEARGQSDAGMVAVGEVILNRVRSPRWKANTIRGVILQKSQFSFFDQLSDLTMYDYKQRLRSYRIASRLIEGTYTPVVGKHAYFYYNPSVVTPSWSHHRYIAVVGDHLFRGLPI